MNDDVEIPSGSSFLESKKQEARSRFTSALEDFKKILSDKTHPDNQTTAYHNNVKSILSRMLSFADSLDKVYPGEGLFGLIVMNFRTSLKLKDEFIKLEVKVRELELEVKKLKTQKK
jgi:hypothetical protein